VVWVGVDGSKFGIGAYSDYVGPAYSQQIPWAHNLTGDDGWLLMWVLDITTSNISEWTANLNQAYSLNLHVVLRIDTDYKFVNGTLPPIFHSFISQLPPPPSALSPLYIIIGNEPNVCDPTVWCSEINKNVTVPWQESAQIAATFLVALLPTLKDIPFIKVSPSPLAIVGHTYCQCYWGAPPPPQSVSGVHYLSTMLEAAPTLYQHADFFSAHPYPCENVVDGQGCIGWNPPEDQAIVGLTYYTQELKTIGINLPVLIAETGWSLGGDEQNNKATWQVQAYQNLYIPDPAVIGVIPFLLTTKGGLYDGFDWVADGNYTYWPVYTAVREYRCSLGFGPC